ncbi:unnamed protein product [Lathyrus sativus]|nr:unnamed protein product [Lathyrus sativus]
MKNFNILRGIVIISSLLSCITCFDDDATVHEAGLTCGSYQYPADGGGNKFNQNLMAAMDAVSFQVKQHGWGAQTLIGNLNPMHVLGECRRDLNPTQCHTCFTQARQLLSRCTPKVSGRIYLDGCFLRYDNYTFFDEGVDFTRDTRTCSVERGETVSPVHVEAVIMNVSKGAGEHMFAMGEAGGVFGLAQCWETVDKWSCQRCLREAGKRLQECVPSSEGSSLFTGCFMRYSTLKFYNDVVVRNDTWTGIPPSIPSSQGQRKSGVWIIAACVISVLVIILLIIPVILMSGKSTTPREKRNSSFGASPSFANVTGFNFRYDVLERATSYFDSANKLGLSEGDGSVFKGTLPSGRMVAVKRLFFDTRQWTDVLFNDVNLINGIKHKNVVKLLGCSIDGLESLLVYEFLPGKSLDQIIFDKDSGNALPWEKRFQIICGIAEGLAYLHEGSGTKIIHREIKSSNIVLDEALNPKIVDFGFSLGSSAENKSHFNTRIAYVAPECLKKGELTEKADVYAFGVMVTEIVCGKKNSVFPQGSNSVINCVWKNYKASNITTSVDPALLGNFVAEEVSNALQVSLLCTQSSPPLRPSMSEVVQMLTKKDYNIPIPIQQPFINYTRLTLDNRTASTVSNMSHGRASSRSSFHSTTSSLHQGEEAILLENPFSSSSKFNTSRSPDSDIQVNIVVAQPR